MFEVGDKVWITEYLGFVNVPATVVFVGSVRKNSPPTVDVRLEMDAGHPAGTVLHYLEHELDKLQILNCSECGESGHVYCHEE